MTPNVKLYMFAGSNAVLTAQLMLTHKRIAYRAVNLPPAAHAPMMLALGFETMTVPALKVDGRRVQGTRQISRFLDELVSEPALFPADPRQRRAVEEAELWGEQFQNAVRRIFYCIARRNPNAFRHVMLGERSRLMRSLLSAATPTIIRLATVRHDATDAAGADDFAAIPARIDQIDAWIAEGVLNGRDLNAADFQIGVNLAAALLSEDTAPLVLGRAANALARRVAPGYTGRVGKSLAATTIPRTLPAQWLASAGTPKPCAFSPSVRPRATELEPRV